MANYSGTECYSNAALALLLANPVFNSFLSNAGNSSSLINAFNALAHCNPNAILNGYQLRSELENVVPRGLYNTYTSQEDCYLFLVDLLEGLEREMPEHLASSFHSLLQLNVTRDSVCSNGHPLKLRDIIDSTSSKSKTGFFTLFDDHIRVYTFFLDKTICNPRKIFPENFSSISSAGSKRLGNKQN